MGYAELGPRFTDKILVDDNGCWLWQAKLNNAGYGVFSVSHKPVYAHRFAYEATHGPIPVGLHLDHLCRVRACANPDHVEPVTPGENFRRSNHPAMRVHRSQRCGRGHDLSDPSAYYVVPKTGHHQCRKCRNQRRREVRAELRATA